LHYNCAMSRFPVAPAALLLLVVSLLSACGFHLRGALTLPPGLEEIQIKARDPYSALARSLERTLLQNGVTLVPASERDAYVAVLDILSERWASRPQSVDQAGRAQEHNLRYAVVFALHNADGDILVPQQAVELSRDYVAAPDDATGIDSERELLTQEMRREMNASILRRIDAAVRGTPN